MITVDCQSCGMPINEEKLFGTEKEGVRSNEYCMYCYEDGEFRQAGITLEDMINICVPHMKEDGMSEEEARTILKQFLPTLKRWRSKKIVQPIMKEKGSFQIIGMTARTSNANEMKANAQIPHLWETYYQQQVFTQIPAASEQPITYGLYSDYVSDVNGEYSVTIGLEANAEELPQGLVAKKIPAAKYLVFTSEKGPLPQIVIKAWQDIWAWFEQSNIERAYTGDFEVYDERCTDPNEARIDIYIAIKESNA